MGRVTLLKNILGVDSYYRIKQLYPIVIVQTTYWNNIGKSKLRMILYDHLSFRPDEAPILQSFY